MHIKVEFKKNITKHRFYEECNIRKDTLKICSLKIKQPVILGSNWCFSWLAIAQQLLRVNERYYVTKCKYPYFDKYVICQDQTVGSVFIELYILQLAVLHTIYSYVKVRFDLNNSAFVVFCLFFSSFCTIFPSCSIQCVGVA